MEEAATSSAKPPNPLDGFDFEAVSSKPLPLVEIDSRESRHRPTGIAELDRVLGGGLVSAASILVGGEPGIGKSTLLLQTLQAVAASGSRPSLLVTAEESREQIRVRADRLGETHARCFIVSESSVVAIVAHMRELQPELIIVDSIQTVSDPRVDSAAGSVTQVRESASALIDAAHEQGSTLIMVGHVTKDGALAGPRVLEHLVDVVLSFEGDRNHGVRTLRAVKNRFGAIDEIGLFEMGSSGLREITHVSAHLLSDRPAESSGSAVACVLAGKRPLLVEIQALVTESHGVPRRSMTGLDSNRVNVLIGVLDKRLSLGIAGNDVYASVVGGIRVSDPAADLGICVSIATSHTGKKLRAGTAFVGEVGLGGEIRSVQQVDQRCRESARFGFDQVIVPRACVDLANEACAEQIDVVGAINVDEVLDRLGAVTAKARGGARGSATEPAEMRRGGLVKNVLR